MGYSRERMLWRRLWLSTARHTEGRKLGSRLRIRRQRERATATTSWRARHLPRAIGKPMSPRANKRGRANLRALARARARARPKDLERARKMAAASDAK